MYLWSFCDSLHFMTPLFSFQKFMNPQYIWDPPSEENASPLTFDAAASKPLTRLQEARGFFAAQKMHVRSRVDSN